MKFYVIQLPIQTKPPQNENVVDSCELGLQESQEAI